MGFPPREPVGRYRVQLFQKFMRFCRIMRVLVVPAPIRRCLGRSCSCNIHVATLEWAAWICLAFTFQHAH